MAYEKTNWQDTLKDGQGNVTQEGTKISASRLNKMENGIADAASKDALELVNQQLADTVKKGDVSVYDINKNKGLIDQTYLADSLKQQIAGTAPINATPANNAVTSEKLSDKSVTPIQTNFLQVVSSNLLDKDSLLIGKTVNSTTGAPSDNASFSLSGFMKAAEGETYITNQQTRYGYYDGNYNFISTFLAAKETHITVPVNTKYMRVAVPTSYINTVALNRGTAVLLYEPYKIKMKDAIVEGSDIRNLQVKQTDLTFLKEQASTNLFNKGTVTLGFSLNSANGAPLANALYSLSELIKAKPSVAYTVTQQVRIAEYRENGTFITGSSVFFPDGGTFTTKADTAFLRIAVGNNYMEYAQLNESDYLLDYEPYAYRLNGVKLQEPLRKADFDDRQRYITEEVPAGIYVQPTVPALLDLATYTADQIYALYDDLVARFPNFVTRTLLGLNSQGANIYRYDFNAVDIPQTTTKKPKMILISGMHGNEKAGIYTMYQAMKAICENWSTHQALEVLRWNAHFIVVPVANPFGVNGGHIRHNPNGIDLERNFRAGWTLKEATDSTYGGTAPLTELESQALDKLFRDNASDTIYFTTFHNFFAENANKDFIWNAGATKLQEQLGKQLISRVSRKWKRELSYLPKDEKTYMGYVSGVINGSSGAQAAAYGIHASTFEICERFYHDVNGQKFDSTVFTLGTEVFVNWLLLNLKENTNDYNNRT